MTASTFCPRGCGRYSRRVLVNTYGKPPLCIECRLRPHAKPGTPTRRPKLLSSQQTALPAVVRQRQKIERDVERAYQRAIRDQRRRRLEAQAAVNRHAQDVLTFLPDWK